MTDGPMTNSPEHAWQLGRAAGLNEVAEGTNPYGPDSELAADWADGWREGTKRINCLVDDDQDWEAWRAVAHSGEPSPNHADAHQPVAQNHISPVVLGPALDPAPVS